MNEPRVVEYVERWMQEMETTCKAVRDAVRASTRATRFMVDEFDSQFTTNLTLELQPSVREPVVYHSILVSASRSGSGTIALGTRIMPFSFVGNTIVEIECNIRLYENDARVLTVASAGGFSQNLYFEMAGIMYPHVTY